MVKNLEKQPDKNFYCDKSLRVNFVRLSNDVGEWEYPLTRFKSLPKLHWTNGKHLDIFNTPPGPLGGLHAETGE